MSRIGGSGVGHDLGQSPTVPQIDENQAAVVAAAIHPPGQLDLLTNVFDA
jgi:hypothetical protein